MDLAYQMELIASASHCYGEIEPRAILHAGELLAAAPLARQWSEEVKKIKFPEKASLHA